MKLSVNQPEAGLEDIYVNMEMQTPPSFRKKVFVSYRKCETHCEVGLE
jgi:hypothetical protein